MTLSFSLSPTVCLSSLSPSLSPSLSFFLDLYASMSLFSRSFMVFLLPLSVVCACVHVGLYTLSSDVFDGSFCAKSNKAASLKGIPESISGDLVLQKDAAGLITASGSQSNLDVFSIYGHVQSQTFDEVNGQVRLFDSRLV